MSTLLHAEWRKVTATRLALGLLLGALAIVALGTGVGLWAPTGESGGLQVEGAPTSLTTQADVVSLLGVASLLNIFALLFGVTFVTAEFRHGTAAATFLAEPRRWRVLAAKAGIAAAVSLLYLVAAFTVSFALLWLAAAMDQTTLPLGADVARHVTLSALAVGLSGPLGVGIGAVIRSQVGAIVATLLWLFVVESLVAGLLPDVSAWMPFAAGGAITGSGGEGLLGPKVATLVVLGYTAAALLAGAMLTERRDVL